jgi:cysteinyl-tRNA synthetase
MKYETMFFEDCRRLNV